jgi:hypothetical protein
MDRQRELQFALLVHTSLNIETARRQINAVHEKVSSTEDKFNITLLFRRLDSPQEVELIKYIDAKGGAEKCMADDNALLELAAMRQKLQGGPVMMNMAEGAAGKSGQYAAGGGTPRFGVGPTSVPPPPMSSRLAQGIYPTPFGSSYPGPPRPGDSAHQFQSGYDFSSEMRQPTSTYIPRTQSQSHGRRGRQGWGWA